MIITECIKCGRKWYNNPIGKGCVCSPLDSLTTRTYVELT